MPFHAGLAMAWLVTHQHSYSRFDFLCVCSNSTTICLVIIKIVGFWDPGLEKRSCSERGYPGSPRLPHSGSRRRAVARGRSCYVFRDQRPPGRPRLANPLLPGNKVHLCQRPGACERQTAGRAEPQGRAFARVSAHSWTSHSSVLPPWLVLSAFSDLGGTGKRLFAPGVRVPPWLSRF